MDPVNLIAKKKNGQALTAEEIDAFIQGYTAGVIPDYQASALLMAICLAGMDEEETYHLTQSMIASGATIPLDGIPGRLVDKHSTGGVGDKTTLIVAPLAAACGVPVAKMSGRGLGFTGGTLDKLESIPGFSTSMTPEQMIEQVRAIGIAVAGQTEDVAKADKLLYALRDVTATVDSPSLIASSIMSKKLAVQSDAIILDVKYGKGAFMATPEEARELADLLEAIGRRSGRQTVTLLTNMDQPLGNAIGNSVEVIEAIQTLRGKGPEDVTSLCLYLAAIMVYLGQGAPSMDRALRKVRVALESGAGLAKFRELVKYQGGDVTIFEDPTIMPRPYHGIDIVSNKTGYLTAVDARMVGNAAGKAGAGRRTKDDVIDPSAGIFLYHKIGDYVEEGERLARLFGNDPDRLRDAIYEMERCFIVGDEPVKAPALFEGI